MNALLSRDAPSERYFPGEVMGHPERRELYMELRQEAGVAAQFNRASEDVFAKGEEVEEEETLAVSKSRSFSECVFVCTELGGRLCVCVKERERE